MINLPFLKSKPKLAKDRVTFGLDIGTQSVKLVRLKSSQGAVELCDFGLEPVELDLAGLLKRMVKLEGAEKINISVSGPATITRLASFPAMNSNELKLSLKFEAQKHIPFPIQDLSLDSAILKDGLPDNKMLVLLSAVKKDFLSQRLKIMEDAGLRAAVVDIDSLALANAFNFNYGQDKEKIGDKAVALLNVGAATSNLDILEEGILRLSRDISIAGNNFTQKAADMLGLDFKAAEELKRNPVREEAQKAAAAVEAVLSTLASEIRTSFDYYESQGSSSVAKIFLSGGGSQFAGLKELLTNLLGMEVQLWDPLRQIKSAGAIDPRKLADIASQLAVAVGLALR
jgi:type IV pilus assembly protein PilM